MLQELLKFLLADGQGLSEEVASSVGHSSTASALGGRALLENGESVRFSAKMLPV